MAHTHLDILSASNRRTQGEKFDLIPIPHTFFEIDIIHATAASLLLHITSSCRVVKPKSIFMIDTCSKPALLFILPFVGDVNQLCSCLNVASIIYNKIIS